ncbi:hypothetical protein [Luteimonas vadosa]|uniref:Uncharacterized protein n=1 Tax=Luteimonas vadosa TaxID=1165507 RepID=A0ABP9E017_9GAMM
MPNATPVIHLDIRNSSQSAPGWVNVNASNGEPYAYRYTGGDDGAGGIQLRVGQGRDTAPLQLDADRRYHIRDPGGCVFTGDTQAQLSWNGNGNYAGSIVDANTQVETAKYTMNVVDSGNGDCIIPCDPIIKNDP